MLVRAEQLTRSFGVRTPVEAVDLELAAGEILGLVGPNGGGKSTLLLLLAGLVRPTSGQVTVGGTAAHRLAVEATGTVGLITAEAGLYPLLSGRENLRWFGGLFGLSASEVDGRAGPLLEELAVDEDLDRPAASYSSGMRQKVSVARALLLRPRLLLLDEPTSNLDPISADILHRAVRARADEGVAVVIATHDLHAAEHLCDLVGVMDRGLLRLERLEGARGAPPAGRLLRMVQEATG